MHRASAFKVHWAKARLRKRGQRTNLNGPHSQRDSPSGHDRIIATLRYSSTAAHPWILRRALRLSPVWRRVDSRLPVKLPRSMLRRATPSDPVEEPHANLTPLHPLRHQAAHVEGCALLTWQDNGCRGARPRSRPPADLSSRGGARPAAPPAPRSRRRVTKFLWI
jgi:hypothetical protein